MKVAILQHDIKWACPADNQKHLEELLLRQPKADLYVLTEMFSTGFATEPEGIAEKDGSSLTCDIQISESQSYETKKVTYSMTIQAVDPQEPAGLTLAEWEAMHNELE